jgi:uncharacterized protein YfaS (alpha-2-macroglobulin family)
VKLAAAGVTDAMTLNGATPVRNKILTQPDAVTVSNGGTAPVVVLSDVRYQPAEPGSKAKPESKGFVVTRQFYRVGAANAPLEKIEADADGVVTVKAGEVIEERVELVSSEDHTHVAITAPLAAGLEPLNPNLANAPAEATASAQPTRTPSWVSFGDDRVFYAYDSLPKGNYRFAFRMRALIAGSFTEPPAEVETMYVKGVYGASAGQRVVVGR